MKILGIYSNNKVKTKTKNVHLLEMIEIVPSNEISTVDHCMFGSTFQCAHNICF